MKVPSPGVVQEMKVDSGDSCRRESPSGRRRQEGENLEKIKNPKRRRGEREREREPGNEPHGGETKAMAMMKDERGVGAWSPLVCLLFLASGLGFGC